MKKIIISPSPHIHSGDSVRNNMYRVALALTPAFLVGLFQFGIGALIVVLTSVVSCVFFEFIIQKYLLRQAVSIQDGSAVVTGVLLGFNLPSNLPIWIILIGALFAIGVCKLSFGGLGHNIFNPAMAARVFLLISFPVQMTSWPKPGQWLSYLDAATGATPLSFMKTSDVSTLEILRKFLGETGGSLGEISTLALLIGFAYLWQRKVILPHIPLTIFLTVFVFTGILHLINPSEYVTPLLHLTTGGIMLGSIYMATDYVTSPMTKTGMVIFGVGIGIITVCIRVWGAYPEGISFAILIMNACTPLINKYVKPKRFGEV